MGKRTTPDTRKPYPPPNATFVSLELEERLMACGKRPNTKTCNPKKAS